jgi:hypothetical protein
MRLEMAESNSKLELMTKSKSCDDVQNLNEKNMKNERRLSLGGNEKKIEINIDEKRPDFDSIDEELLQRLRAVDLEPSIPPIKSSEILPPENKNPLRLLGSFSTLHPFKNFKSLNIFPKKSISDSDLNAKLEKEKEKVLKLPVRDSKNFSAFFGRKNNRNNNIDTDDNENENNLGIEKRNKNDRDNEGDEEEEEEEEEEERFSENLDDLSIEKNSDRHLSQNENDNENEIDENDNELFSFNDIYDDKNNSEFAKSGSEKTEISVNINDDFIFGENNFYSMNAEKIHRKNETRENDNDKFGKSDHILMIENGVFNSVTHSSKTARSEESVENDTEGNDGFQLKNIFEDVSATEDTNLRENASKKEKTDHQYVDIENEYGRERERVGEGEGGKESRVQSDRHEDGSVTESDCVAADSDNNFTPNVTDSDVTKSRKSNDRDDESESNNSFYDSTNNDNNNSNKINVNSKNYNSTNDNIIIMTNNIANNFTNSNNTNNNVNGTNNTHNMNNINTANPPRNAPAVPSNTQRTYASSVSTHNALHTLTKSRSTNSLKIGGGPGVFTSRDFPPPSGRPSGEGKR